MSIAQRTPHAVRTRHLRVLALAVYAAGALSLSAGCSRKPESRTFTTAEEAVEGLAQAVKSGDLEELLRIFGPDGRDLASSSDPATGRRNREVFIVAMAEGWRLVDIAPNAKELVLGNEDWPFPVPLVKEGDAWRFDTAAGKEEVLDRRIGRNELAVIRIGKTYVLAQRAYASRGHDGHTPGQFARRFNSSPGAQDGLYWPAKASEPRSPLGDLVAQAAKEGRPIADRTTPAPFHGYHFRILEAQGANAPGGAVDYVVDGRMSRGFALVAWPAQYGATGIMTFIVGQDGVVYEKDLGPQTDAAASAIKRYDPDATWRKAEADVPQPSSEE